MKFELYKKRPVWTHTYMLPLFGYPLVFGVCNRYTFGENGTSGAAVGLFFWALVQGFLFLSSFWGCAIYKASKLERARTPREADMVLVTVDQGLGRGESKGFAPLKRKSVALEGSVVCIEWFEYMNSLFYFEGGRACKLETNLAHPFSTYHEEDAVIDRIFRNACEKVILPENEFNIEPPTFLRMFAEHAVSPFFVFQIFCAFLWMLDEYWKYSLFTFATIILFEGGMVFQRLANIRQMRSLNLKPQKIVRVRGGRKEEVPSTHLRPGDRIVVSERVQVPADLLIIKGEAVVNESMLSGEATPVPKESAPCTKDVFEQGRHKKHVLFGGTKILKVSKGGVECVVLRTGFMTEQGELVKSMIASEDVVSENNKEAYMFILAMLVFAVAACVYVARESVGLGKSTYKIILECIMILTNVVPPELPMELTIAVNSSLQELVTLGVYCLEPFRIPFAGKITVCCFDKTGTLTELNFQLDRLKKAQREKASVVLGTCHSAIILDGKVEGDPLDVCGLEYIGAQLTTDSTVVIEEEKYEIVKKFSFDSDLKRATALVRKDKEYFVVMKGAPETVATHLKQVPEVYAEFERYAAKGYRVLALGMKSVTDARTAATQERHVMEKNLEFVGFALYNSKLKEGAKQTVAHLLESGHKVIMITGDNEKTAISVAKQVGMYNQKHLSGPSAIGKFLEDAAGLPKDAQKKLVWPSVFARATPETKENILSLLNSMGEYTLMCGDGTNDVGALKTAHAGIALLEGTKTKGKAITLPGNIGQSMFVLDEEIKLKLGDASIAAPFTSRTGSLQSVIDVISRGRSALVSTVQMYKVLALNSLLSAYTLSMFDTMGVKYGDFQMTAAGVLSSLSFAFFGKSRPLPRLSREKPVAKIFSPYIVVSVVFQTLVHVSAFYLVYLGVLKYEKITLHDKFSPSIANTSMFLLSLGLQVTTLIVNYVGRPFRENLTENTKLLSSLLVSVGLVVLCTLEVVPELNEKMELAAIPGDIKARLLSVMGADFILCLGIERLAFTTFMTTKKPGSSFSVPELQKKKAE
ncbi:manganese-transporting P-type ATPase [Nematocida sp. AWRm77]|nr:manganese-transporting P-type ATPase [Nematocida sp. AWRm77]